MNFSTCFTFYWAFKNVKFVILYIHLNMKNVGSDKKIVNNYPLFSLACISAPRWSNESLLCCTVHLNNHQSSNTQTAVFMYLYNDHYNICILCTLILTIFKSPKQISYSLTECFNVATIYCFVNKNRLHVETVRHRNIAIGCKVHRHSDST